MSASHLLSIVDDVLDTAKNEAGAADVVTGPVGVGGVIAEVAEVLHRGRPLCAADPSKAVTVRSETANRRRLRRPLLNVVSNAIKYDRVGLGAVTMSGRPWSVTRTAITVLDDGNGIPAAIRDRLFTPFVGAAEGATTRRATVSGSWWPASCWRSWR